MNIDFNSTNVAIKKAGKSNVRIIPMAGQSITEGEYQIEINNNGIWSPVLTSVKKQIAEQIVSQALNRVILG